MIADLRRRHRSTVTILFVVVVFLYTWAIVARRATPRVPHPPGAAPAARGTEHVVH